MSAISRALRALENERRLTIAALRGREHMLPAPPEDCSIAELRAAYDRYVAECFARLGGGK